MEFKLNSLDKCNQEVDFEIPYDELTPHFEKAFKKFQKEASVPGFRKGKVPISMLKRMHGEAIEKSSLEDIANDIFRDYLKENHVHLLSEGSLVDIDYEPKILLKFKVKYEILPDFELADYKGLEVNKTIYPVNEKAIDDEIEYLRARNCTYEEREKADADDYLLTFDVQKLDHAGFPVIGQSEKGVKFFLSDKQLSVELKNQLRGFTKDEERIVKTKDGENDISYKMKCTKAEKILFPELNEEFFQKIYGDENVKDVKAFREKVNSDIENIYKNMSQRELNDTIVNDLIKINEIPVPDSLVEKVIDSYVHEVKHHNPKGKPPEDFDEQEFRKTKRVDAILEVKWYLVMDKIVEKEKLEITDADLEPLVEAESKKYNIPIEKIRSLYQKNEDVKRRMLETKVMEFLVKNANIKEVVKSEESKIEA